MILLWDYPMQRCPHCLQLFEVWEMYVELEQQRPRLICADCRRVDTVEVAGGVL